MKSLHRNFQSPSFTESRYFQTCVHWLLFRRMWKVVATLWRLNLLYLSFEFPTNIFDILHECVCSPLTEFTLSWGKLFTQLSISVENRHVSRQTKTQKKNQLLKKNIRLSLSFGPWKIEICQCNQFAIVRSILNNCAYYLLGIIHVQFEDSNK